MSELAGFSSSLVELVGKWDRFAIDPSERARVGIKPKPNNLRGLHALLVKQPVEQLNALIAICSSRWAKAGQLDERDFWAHHKNAVEVAIQKRDEIKKREKQRKRSRRKRDASKLEAEYAAEKKRMLDPRLGMGLSTSSVYYGTSKTVQGGAPGSGKRS